MRLQAKFLQVASLGVRTEAEPTQCRDLIGTLSGEMIMLSSPFSAHVSVQIHQCRLEESWWRFPRCWWCCWEQWVPGDVCQLFFGHGLQQLFHHLVFSPLWSGWLIALHKLGSKHCKCCVNGVRNTVTVLMYFYILDNHFCCPCNTHLLSSASVLLMPFTFAYPQNKCHLDVRQETGIIPWTAT